MKALALILICLGVLAIIYGGFWYTSEETKAELGPIKIEIEQRRRFNVPLWVGVGAVAAGTAILLIKKPK